MKNSALNNHHKATLLLIYTPSTISLPLISILLSTFLCNLSSVAAATRPNGSGAQQRKEVAALTCARPSRFYLLCTLMAS